MASDVWAEKLLSKYWFEPQKDGGMSGGAAEVESLLLLLLLIQAPNPEDQDVCVCSVDLNRTSPLPGSVASGRRGPWGRGF